MDGRRVQETSTNAFLLPDSSQCAILLGESPSTTGQFTGEVSFVQVCTNLHFTFLHPAHTVAAVRRLSQRRGHSGHDIRLPRLGAPNHNAYRYTMDRVYDCGSLQLRSASCPSRDLRNLRLLAWTP